MKRLLFFPLFGILLFCPLVSQAATLFFSEPASSYSVGDTFSVTVYVGSQDQAMNAASAVVSFPWSTLEVVSLSKTGSLFSTWAEEPSFSNSAGTVSLEGIVLNPGFKGAAGKLLTIFFKAKTVGQANLNFSSGSVLANDGTGTNILTGSGVAVINVGVKSSPPPLPPTESVVQNNAPTITSSTHPDQTKWYKSNSPEFSWTLPSGALEVRTLVGTLPKSQPSISYAPPISSKKVDALPDGTYYFHLQIRTTAGWSEVAHYRVNIDTTPPRPFSVTFPHGVSGFDPQPVILFDTTDAESGVSHYEIKIGSGGAKRVAPVALSNPYPLPPQEPGEHMVTVVAYDRAGNTASASSDFIIEGIEAPTITSYPNELAFGDLARIQGTTYENSDVTIRISRGSEMVSEEQTRSNNLGDFALIVTKRLDPGVYTFTARVTDARGARSNETAPFTITVNSKLFGGLADTVPIYLLALLALVALIGVGVFMRHRLLKLVTHLRHEGMGAERVLEKSFDTLHADIDKHLELLKAVRSKRNLTKEEITFLEKFTKSLTKAERIISKEIQDVSHDA